MFEQNSLRDSDISPRDAGEKGQTYILVKPGEAPSTKRTERMVVEETPQVLYRCVPVTDYKDLVMGKKKRRKS
jgi:hypothetical protein